jgi:lipopolysaccharide/colanic/teichoic acid biosynthesis glycosyltransferase
MTKRFFDIFLATMGLIAFAPLMVLIAAAIKIETPGPIFFRQERVGRHGVIFRIFKFRTMVHVQTNQSPQLTVGGDPRITQVGTKLRGKKLDELPQLLDVLRGTMSLVGPRPEVPRYVAHYPEPIRTQVLSVRPGITDLASLRYRHENDLLAQAPDPEREYLEVILPTKLQYAVHYIQTQSLLGDLRILGLSLWVVFGRTQDARDR